MEKSRETTSTIYLGPGSGACFEADSTYVPLREVYIHICIYILVYRDTQGLGARIDLSPKVLRLRA